MVIHRADKACGDGAKGDYVIQISREDIFFRVEASVARRLYPEGIFFNGLGVSCRYQDCLGPGCCRGSHGHGLGNGLGALEIAGTAAYRRGKAAGFCKSVMIQFNAAGIGRLFCTFRISKPNGQNHKIKERFMIFSGFINPQHGDTVSFRAFKQGMETGS